MAASPTDNRRPCRLYCTHTTFAESVLEDVSGEAGAKVLGYSVRASSSADQAENRDVFRTVERFLSYELPCDTPATEKERLNAASAPRRLFFIPAAAQFQVVGQICYRSHDTAGRPGSYFADLVAMPRKDGAIISARECVQLWAAAADGFIPKDCEWWCDSKEKVDESRERRPFAPDPLPMFNADRAAEVSAGQKFAEAVRRRGGSRTFDRCPPVITDDLLEAFLSCETAEEFVGRDPHEVIPPRWHTIACGIRQRLLERLVRATIGILNPQETDRNRARLVVAAEPSVAALLFYGILRLLPDGMVRRGAGVSFSTFEPAPERATVNLAATTFYGEEQSSADLPVDLRCFSCNTFRRVASDFKYANQHGFCIDEDDYARWSVECAATGACSKVDELCELLEKAAPGIVAASLDQVIVADREVRDYVRPGGRRSSRPVTDADAITFRQSLFIKLLIEQHSDGKACPHDVLAKVRQWLPNEWRDDDWRSSGEFHDILKGEINRLVNQVDGEEWLKAQIEKPEADRLPASLAAAGIVALAETQGRLPEEILCPGLRSGLGAAKKWQLLADAVAGTEQRAVGHVAWRLKLLATGDLKESYVRLKTDLEGMFTSGATPSELAMAFAPKKGWWSSGDGLRARAEALKQWASITRDPRASKAKVDRCHDFFVALAELARAAEKRGAKCDDDQRRQAIGNVKKSMEAICRDTNSPFTAQHSTFAGDAQVEGGGSFDQTIDMLCGSNVLSRTAGDLLNKWMDESIYDGGEGRSTSERSSRGWENQDWGKLKDRMFVAGIALVGIVFFLSVIGWLYIPAVKSWAQSRSAAKQREKAEAEQRAVAEVERVADAKAKAVAEAKAKAKAKSDEVAKAAAKEQAARRADEALAKLRGDLSLKSTVAGGKLVVSWKQDLGKTYEGLQLKLKLPDGVENVSGDVASYTFPGIPDKGNVVLEATLPSDRTVVVKSEDLPLAEISDRLKKQLQPKFKTATLVPYDGKQKAFAPWCVEVDVQQDERDLMERLGDVSVKAMLKPAEAGVAGMDREITGDWRDDNKTLRFAIDATLNPSDVAKARLEVWCEVKLGTGKFEGKHSDVKTQGLIESNIQGFMEEQQKRMEKAHEGVALWPIGEQAAELPALPLHPFVDAAAIEPVLLGPRVKQQNASGGYVFVNFDVEKVNSEPIWRIYYAGQPQVRLGEFLLDQKDPWQPLWRYKPPPTRGNSEASETASADETKQRHLAMKLSMSKLWLVYSKLNDKKSLILFTCQLWRPWTAAKSFALDFDELQKEVENRPPIGNRGRTRVGVVDLEPAKLPDSAAIEFIARGIKQPEDESLLVKLPSSETPLPSELQLLTKQSKLMADCSITYYPPTATYRFNSTLVFVKMKPRDEQKIPRGLAIEVSEWQARWRVGMSNKTHEKFSGIPIIDPYVIAAICTNREQAMPAASSGLPLKNEGAK